MKEVTLSPQGENSQFSEIVTLLKLLLCEMNENPSYQLTITPNPFESFLSIFFKKGKRDSCREEGVTF